MINTGIFMQLEKCLGCKKEVDEDIIFHLGDNYGDGEFLCEQCFNESCKETKEMIKESIKLEND